MNQWQERIPQSAPQAQMGMIRRPTGHGMWLRKGKGVGPKRVGEGGKRAREGGMGARGQERGGEGRQGKRGGEAGRGREGGGGWDCPSRMYKWESLFPML